MKRLLPTIAALAIALAAGTAHAESRDVRIDVWADNWFELSVDGEPVLEDSVPITTERSFNAETTTVAIDLPAVLAVTAKDFKENDSGLEYIGSRRQQMGDGGLILQVRDAGTGEVLGASDGSTKCLVVHRAPLDPSCADEADPVAGEGACGFEETAIPEGWASPDFDDADWPAATVHSVRDVSPKDGYDEIDWDESAQLVWGPDLKQDNTILCRLSVGE